MKHFEDILDMPVRDVLPLLQERFLAHTYKGIVTQRNPWDAWAYQEIIHRTKPTVIVEVGVYAGGQTIYLSELADAMILGVDVDMGKVAWMQTPGGVHWIQSDGAAAAEKIKKMIDPERARVMVIEDSSHVYEQTLSVLRAYADIVTPGCYLICEDSICHHPLPVGPNPGPMQAIETFLFEDDRYESDREVEPLITWNPCGYLKRLR